METWLSSKQLYSGKIVGLRVGEVRLADGTVAPREVVEHPGGVGIVPVVDGSVVLIRQYRIAIGSYILEIPAGKLEKGPPPQEQARRELEEETGYRASRLVSLGSIFASVGYTSEEIHMFLAFDLEQVGAKPDHDERIETVLIPISELEQRLARNEFQDAKTIVGLTMLLRHLNADPAL